MIPGEYFISDRPVVANKGKKTASVKVSNTGNRPIQVGSHAHFFEVNKALLFPRAKAYGMHLNIPAGTSLRFEPGDLREVELVEYGGKKIVYGFSGLVNGRLAAKKSQAMAKAKARGFKGA
ncbi:MAG: urease subunit beta [Nitrososphaera sp.]|uniref:urease subunit beta n=1 Tax=Nitrososphaera sp. TaxID=1971748 RepID=UPI003D6E3443